MTNVVKWLLEESITVNDNEHIRLSEEIKRQGMEVSIVNKNTKIEILDQPDCIVYHGGLNLALSLLKRTKWIPCAWLIPDNFKCSFYYSYVGKCLLNEDYIMLPLSEINRRKETLFTHCQELFIRPDSGLKSFNAKLYRKSTFTDDFSYAELLCAPSTMCVISSPKKIESEWRFIIGNRSVVAGCRYMANGEFNPHKHYPENLIPYVNKIINSLPDIAPMYVIDICSCDCKYYLMEINSFSCAGLYECNLEPIVKCASKIALKEWNEHQ